MYTITYKGMDSAMFEVGKTNPTAYTVETETFTLNNPTRKGYTFAGWTGTNLDRVSKEVTIAKGTTGDITLTANWTIVTYGITYSLGDGALKAGETNPTEHTVETETFTLNNPTRKGYTFAGWTGTKLDRVSKEVTIAKGTTGALCYMANWAIEQRGVTLTGGTGISGFEYRVNGGGLKTFDQQATILVYYGSTLEIKAIAAPGYRFTKWDDGETKNPRTLKANETVTLEASADAVEYAITYEMGGGALKAGETNPETYTVETVVLLSHKKADSYIHIDVEFGEGEGKIPVDSIAKRAEAYKPKEKVTYKMIKEYIEAKYGFKVHTAYIAEVKRNLGLPMYDAPNAVEELKQPRKHPTPEKVEAIKDALRYFAVI